MFRYFFMLCCLCLGVVWAEEIGTPAVIHQWRTVLDGELLQLSRIYPEGTPEYEAAREACDNAVSAAAALRQARLEYVDASLNLFGDVNRPQLDVIVRMRDAYERFVDASLMQDLRTVVSFSAWSRHNDFGFLLRTPADAALWLDGAGSGLPGAPTSGKTSALPRLFSGRTGHSPAAAGIMAGTMRGIHMHMSMLYAQEVAALYGEKGFTIKADPLTGTTDTRRERVLPEDIREVRAAFDAAECAWLEYAETVCTLAAPPLITNPTTAAICADMVTERLCATHMAHLQFITTGIQAALIPSRQEGVFQVSCGQSRYPFGEIFHDYAMLFRHPYLPGNPWCLTMAGLHDTADTLPFVFVPSCPELEAYATEHPEGGMAFVHGYFDVEVEGKPYEPVNRPADENGNIPSPRPEDAYTIRPVFRAISIMHLKW